MGVLGGRPAVPAAEASAGTVAAGSSLLLGTKDQLDALRKDKVKLTKALTYFIVPGNVMAKDVKPGMVKTVEGQSIATKSEGGKVTVDNAVVTRTDVEADNGVMHVIDTVIMPKL